MEATGEEEWTEGKTLDALCCPDRPDWCRKKGARLRGRSQTLPRCTSPYRALLLIQLALIDAHTRIDTTVPGKAMLCSERFLRGAPVDDHLESEDTVE